MSLFGTGRREGILAVLLLAVLALALHAEGLLGRSRRWVADDQLPPRAQASAATGAILQSEAAVNQTRFVPAMQAASRAAADGKLPLWNKDARFGEPFSASGAAVWYPGFWPLLMRDGAVFLEWILWLHTALACAGMYRFLRSLPVHRYTAFLGGGLYGFGWYFTLQLDRLPQAAAAALLPFALEAIWRTLISRNRRWLPPLLGIALALPFLTGGTATASIGAVLVGLLFVTHLPLLESLHRRLALRTLAIGVAIAIALSAPVWLDALQQSPALDPQQAPRQHLQLTGLIGVAAPDAFALRNGADGGILPLANPGADPLELALYPGALTLFLLLLGLLRPKRTVYSLFWVASAGVGLLLTLDGPFADAVRTLGFAPARAGVALWLTHVGLVVLACLALENFFDAPMRRSKATVLTSIGCIAGAIAMLVVAWIEPRPLRELLHSLTHDVSTDRAFPVLRAALLRTALMVALVATLFLIWKRLGILRFKVALAVVCLGEVLHLGFTHTPRTDEASTSTFAARLPREGRLVTVGRRALPPASEATADGIPTVNTDGAQILRRTAQYLDEIDPTLQEGRHHGQLRPLFFPGLLTHPLVRQAGIDVAVAAHAFHAEGFAPLSAMPTAPSASPHLHLATRFPTTPIAELRYLVEHVADAKAALAALRRLGDGVDETLVLEGADRTLEARRPGAAATVRILEHDAERMTLTVEMGQGRGWLLIREAMAPGWRATIDGVPANVVAANVAFRGVFVPEGRHEVRFVYAPWARTIGLPLVVLGLAAALGYFVAWLLRVRPVRVQKRRRLLLPSGGS